MSILQHLIPAQGGPRECGPGRQEGHIYAECGFAPGGMPIEHFLIDCPQPVNPAHLGLSTQGVTLIERQGVWHIVDFVGESHYPFPSDFIEEARAIGISRKLPRTTAFSKLGPHSTIILIHPKAALTNALQVSSYTTRWDCPCGKGHAPTEPCACWHWYAPKPTIPGTLKRQLKRTTYEVNPLLSGAPALQFTPGYFLRVPLSNLSVIRNRDGRVNPHSRNLANQARVPVFDADS